MEYYSGNFPSPWGVNCQFPTVIFTEQIPTKKDRFKGQNRDQPTVAFLFFELEADAIIFLC